MFMKDHSRGIGEVLDILLCLSPRQNLAQILLYCMRERQTMQLVDLVSACLMISSPQPTHLNIACFQAAHCGSGSVSSTSVRIRI